MTTLPVRHTLAEVAASLQCSQRTVRDLIKAGVIAPMRVGVSGTGPYRFTDDDVQALETALRPAPVEPKKRRRRRVA